MITGVDYAFSPHPALPAVLGCGASFVCRYASSLPENDANGKNLLAPELAGLLQAGLSVVVVEESSANRMKGGRAAGVIDAAHADAVTKALGMNGIPVYFACDFDAAPGDQMAIHDYLDGAASVIGRDRVGIYGGYYPLMRALDAGKAKWAWQTYAWSRGTESGPLPHPHAARVKVGSSWFWFDDRAQIRQFEAVSLGGASCDRDEAQFEDYGQWPRPVIVPVSQKAVPVNLPVLGRGAAGNAVRTVQALAGARRGHDLAIDGDFGPATDLAVRGVQSAAHLTADGIVGADTWKALLLG